MAKTARSSCLINLKTLWAFVLTRVASGILCIKGTWAGEWFEEKTRLTTFGTLDKPWHFRWRYIQPWNILKNKHRTPIQCNTATMAMPLTKDNSCKTNECSTATLATPLTKDNSCNANGCNPAKVATPLTKGNHSIPIGCNAATNAMPLTKDNRCKTIECNMSKEAMPLTKDNLCNTNEGNTAKEATLLISCRNWHWTRSPYSDPHQFHAIWFFHFCRWQSL